jgi:glutamyl-tRNA reductase
MLFGAVGISHWKSDVSIREQFYLSESDKSALLARLHEIVPGALILDTCNRIEIYAECDPKLLIEPLCTASGVGVSFFNENGYQYKNELAIYHLFKVGLGLDSQILGDIQIIQQLKKSYKLSASNYSRNFHELLQAVFRAHKRTRNETNFASGAASVGYAATQNVIKEFTDISNIKVLLIGAGKMGKNVSKNLVTQGVQELAVINRTYKKAERLANGYHISAHTFEELDDKLEKADVIITATGSNHPILTKKNVEPLSDKRRLIIDLSVPRNVSLSVGELANVTLIDMDTISIITQKAIEERKTIIPKVETIIAEEQKNLLAKLKRSEILAPQLEVIHAHIAAITENELERIKNKVGEEAYEKLESVTHRIKKKIIAFHVQHLEKELIGDEN